MVDYAASSQSALGQLGVLVGKWEVGSPHVNERQRVNSRAQPGPKGRSDIEWLADGAYLMVHDIVPAPGPSGTWVIGADDTSRDLTILHHDERGVSRVYRSAFAQGHWRVWRDAPGFSQRFTATVAEDGSTMHATWEKSLDGAVWEHDFDLVYTRLS